MAQLQAKAVAKSVVALTALSASVFFTALLTTPAAQAQTPASCPSLGDYYPTIFFAQQGLPSGDAEAEPARAAWQQLAQELRALQDSCLRSSEYYALLGAAEMNRGATDSAAEALERALLLDPNNGAAQIDYASVLFALGQLFPALQLNDQLLGREDLPTELRESLVSRGQNWRGATKQHRLVADVSAGYDNNLNGAPNVELLTLTLSGEPVQLALNEDFQQQAGGYSTLKLTSSHQTRTDEGRHGWEHEARGRVSQDTQSDLLQFSSQYSTVRASRRRTVQWDAGATTLFFGGSALYTASQTRLRVQNTSSKRCAPVVDLATQYQRFHSQPALDAWESRTTAGLNCVTALRSGTALRYGFDAGYIYSKALSANRPGADRDGVQASARFQRALLRGELFMQASVTHLNDDKGYSALLANGEARWQRRNQALIQHRTPFALGSKTAQFTITAFLQRQSSNIALFDTKDASLEFGFSVPI